jgi:hypothetical protein
MIEIDDEKVVFSRKTWEELRNDNYFRELIEVIEDREEYNKALAETEYFKDYDEYRKKRLLKMNV